MPIALPTPPSSILLATDLSARSDRALERAVQLARHWQARLVLLVVLPQESSFSRPNHFQHDDEDEDDAPSAADLVRERIREELDTLDIALDIRVEAPGHVGETALRVAQETGSGLIITGIARSDAMQRVALGSTVIWLSRHSPIPVLVVQRRVREPYRRVAVASDLSEAASLALGTAAGWFGDSQTRLVVHGYDVSLRELAGSDAEREATLAEAEASARQALLEWRNAALPDAQRAQWEARALLCNPIRLLRQVSNEEALDLAVIASHGRTRLMDVLIGSVAKRLLETAVTDTLIVRG